MILLFLYLFFIKYNLIIFSYFTLQIDNFFYLKYILLYFYFINLLLLLSLLI